MSIKPSSPDSSDSGLQVLPAVAISIAELGELGPKGEPLWYGSRLHARGEAFYAPPVSPSREPEWSYSFNQVLQWTGENDLD